MHPHLYDTCMYIHNTIVRNTINQLINWFIFAKVIIINSASSEAEAIPTLLPITFIPWL